MTTKNWRAYFQHNREHRRPIPWQLGVRVEPGLRGPLIHSLKRFQIGESGEGRHLRRLAAETGDERYAATIDLFIREEQEHARLMAKVLHRLDAPLLKSHWSDVCFILLRRFSGLKTELLVLLVAEMIAKGCFRALHEGTDDPVLRAVCAQILHDEAGHVAFHVDVLRRALSGLSLPMRALTRAAWRTLFRVACLVVILDHRAVLRAVRVSPAQFWWDCGLILDQVSAEILGFCALAEPAPA